MIKQVLDVQQMQHLQELGLDTSNASMCWLKTPSGRDLTFNDEWINLDNSILDPIPAYTLQDVLEHLPVKLGVNGNIHITRDFLTSAWTVEYFEGATLGRVSFYNEELIDAAYDMLCLLVEKGYVKNKA